MVRAVLTGLVAILSGVAVCWVVRGTGQDPASHRGRPTVSVRATETTGPTRTVLARLPAPARSQLPSPATLVFDPPDMSGPPLDLAAVVAPVARVMPNVPDGPPMTEADRPPVSAPPGRDQPR